ncbi:MAG: NADPH-dependent F420 reductase [Nitrososphaerales archaeon]
MKIGIVGGTGGMGEGLALRWCLNHDLVVGSRDAQRAVDAASSYTKMASEAYGSRMKGSIAGQDNIALAGECDLLVLSIHYEHADDTCSKLAALIKESCIVVSPIVPMNKGSGGFEYIPIHNSSNGGPTSAADKVAAKLPPRSRVVSALHTISEVKLKHLNESLDSDILLCGDDPAAVKTVSDLVGEISGLRAIYLGPLSLSYQAEMMTPMLLNAAKQNKIKHPGLKIV